MELMLVPKSRSSRLLYDYSYSLPITANAPLYDATTFPFKRLLNFFDNSASGPQLYRFFEYVQVPSRFVGTETLLNPQFFSQNVPETVGFRPPFNTVSNYREPGRININTIMASNPATPTENAVWLAILNGQTGPTLDQIRDSRQGGTPLMSNPFRSFGGAALTLPGTPQRKEMDVTLLRAKDPSNPNSSPLFDFQSGNAYNNTDRNPYFRFQTLEKLSNLLTTRSNVYAVWITVGYFEVMPWPNPNGAPTPDPPAGPSTGHPDGYQLGSELGSDTGDVHRHRAFYMIDRTIPVGFERGKSYNVDRAILLKRFIE
jgi:hypothetical protein